MLSMEILERLEQRLDEAQSAFSLARQALRVEFVQAFNTNVQDASQTLNKNEDTQVPTNKETTSSTEFMITTGQNLRKTFFQQFGRNIDIEDLHQLLQAALDESANERDVIGQPTKRMPRRETSLEDEKEREASGAATEEQEEAAIEEFHRQMAEKFRKMVGRSMTAEEHAAWMNRFSTMRFVDADFPSNGDSDDSDFNPEAEAEQEQLMSDMCEDEREDDDEKPAETQQEIEREIEKLDIRDQTNDNETHREIISAFMQTEFGSDEDDSDYEPESEGMGTESDTSEFSGQDDDDTESGDGQGDYEPTTQSEDQQDGPNISEC